MKPFIPELDKANHFVAGTVICGLAMLIISPLTALILTAIAGAAKEGYDLVSEKGNPDLKDFLYTVAGALPVLISHL